MMKINIFIIIILITAVVALELHPAVKESRVFVPEEIYAGKECGCECIANSRPWYSVLNYWFCLWFLAVPLIMFSVTPQSPQWQRIIRTLGAVLLCYGAMNLALHLMWDIRNGPFSVNNNYPWQKSWDDPGTKCANIADGASIVFTAFFGWIYAAIYTGWWEILWYHYHKRKTRLLTDDFKRDWISKAVAVISKYITLFMLLAIILIPFALAGLYALQKLGMVK